MALVKVGRRGFARGFLLVSVYDTPCSDSLLFNLKDADLSEMHNLSKASRDAVVSAESGDPARRRTDLFYHIHSN